MRQYHQNRIAILGISANENCRFGKHFFKDLDSVDDAYRCVSPDNRALVLRPEGDEIAPLTYVREFLEKKGLVQLKILPQLELLAFSLHPHRDQSYPRNYPTLLFFERTFTQM